MIVCCMTAIVNVVGNYFLIPIFGAKAAAGTTAMCSLFILVLLLFKVDKRIKVERVGALIFSPLIGCVGIIAVCMACKGIDDLWIRFAFSLVGSVSVYLLIQILLKNELVSEILETVKWKIKKQK